MKQFDKFLTLAAALLAPSLATAQQASDTRSVTDHYLELTLNQRYDDLLDVYATDAVFLDVTGDVFRGPVSQGEVRGAETIVTMQKDWGLASARFEQAASFTVGEYTIYRGTFFAGYGNRGETEIPFVTVLRAQNGRIAERNDFGEYIESFGLGDEFDENTASTTDVARRYLQAYLDEDFDTQLELMADDAVFQDPTAPLCQYR